MALQHQMESSQQRQMRLQDNSDHKVICSQLETLEKRAVTYNFIYSCDFTNIVDACVEFCFLKKEFLNLTINMQPLYFITTVTSQVHSARHHQHAGTVLYQASSSLIYLLL